MADVIVLDAVENVRKVSEEVKNKVNNLDTSLSASIGTASSKIDATQNSVIDNRNYILGRIFSVNTLDWYNLDKRISKMVYPPFEERYTTGWQYIKIPYGVTRIRINACAGGGGGAGGYSSTNREYGGGGGGGGEWVEGFIWNVPQELWDANVSIHVGGGGAGGTQTTNGGNGSATIINGVLTLNGGSGGTSRNGGSAGGASAGAGGNYGNNGENSPKSSGGSYCTASTYYGGGGGASWGNGGSCAGAGAGFGGGGAGAQYYNYAHSGQNGGNGFCNFYFEW